MPSDYEIACAACEFKDKAAACMFECKLAFQQGQWCGQLADGKSMKDQQEDTIKENIYVQTKEKTHIKNASQNGPKRDIL